MKKITFLGDIVCDKPLLKAADKEQGFQFDAVFKEVKGLFEESEYVVGALETTFSGSDKGYNSRSFAYNSPDELAQSIKDCGINVLTLSNNHCLDYGIDGLARTVHLLDDKSILSTGAKATGNKYLILRCGSVKVAILSYTAVMNPKPGAKAFSRREKEATNLLAEITPPMTASLIIKRIIPSQIRELLKKAYLKNKVRNKVPTMNVVIDDNDLTDRDDAYIKEFVQTALEAKQEADLVIACVHSGGQFNKTPGKRTKQLFERISSCVDVIIGNHPHVIQAVESDEKTVKAYSLGTMNLSLSADYISFENLPQYSLALHIYIDEVNRNIGKITYSILHSEEDAYGYVNVKPIEKWLSSQKDIDPKTMEELMQIHFTILQRESSFDEMKSEYDI